MLEKNIATLYKEKLEFIKGVTKSREGKPGTIYRTDL
jgi:hypothetical protein